MFSIPNHLSKVSMDGFLHRLTDLTRIIVSMATLAKFDMLIVLWRSQKVLGTKFAWSRVLKITRNFALASLRSLSTALES